MIDSNNIEVMRENIRELAQRGTIGQEEIDEIYEDINTLSGEIVDLTSEVDENRTNISAINSKLDNKFVTGRAKTVAELEAYVISDVCPVGVSFCPVNYGGSTNALISKVSDAMYTLWLFSGYGNAMQSICLRDGNRTVYNFSGTAGQVT